MAVTQKTGGSFEVLILSYKATFYGTTQIKIMLKKTIYNKKILKAAIEETE